MRVLLKTILDCDPDAAWRALHSPTVMREVAGPLVDFVPLEEGGFPTSWDGREHVAAMQTGPFTAGRQSIRLRDMKPRVEGVRIVRDDGHGLSGLMSIPTSMRHSMAVSADPAGPDADGRVKTLFRDQLEFEAGLLGPAMWPTFWAFWQWRAFRLRQLAPTWAYDWEPETDPDAADPAAADDAGLSAR
jgi:hypothetical protein